MGSNLHCHHLPKNKPVLLFTCCSPLPVRFWLMMFPFVGEGRCLWRFPLESNALKLFLTQE